MSRKLICGSVFFNIRNNNVRNIKDIMYDQIDLNKEFDIDTSISFEIIDCVGDNYFTHCLIIYGFTDLEEYPSDIKQKLYDTLYKRFEYYEMINIDIVCFEIAPEI